MAKVQFKRVGSVCGIVGIVNFSNNGVDRALVSHMISQLSHRGPDDQQVWFQDPVALGFARLAIHDLTPTGQQPMFSFNREWMIIFNGEIYNFNAIKDKILLENNIIFIGHSDSEVLINAIALWGVEKTLRQCVGMFAFAAYHLSEKKLYLARDRFGEKPLYFGMQNKIFAFASELKALKPLKEKGWTFQIDRDALATYMRFAYIPTPHCIFKEIRKLTPGHILIIDQDGNQSESTFWNPQEVLYQPQFSGDYTEGALILESLIKDSVKLQMASDVPLGAFLSGGVDSSTIVAFMQAQSSQKINTFSIGFHEAQFDEAKYAKAVAEYLGTNHTEVTVCENDALNVIPKLSLIYDEPFADSSQIPTYLVSQLARSKVTVSLTGDAGDELFGGYNRYLVAQKIKSTILANPVVATLMRNMPTFALKLMATLTSRYSQPFDKLLKLQNILRNAKNCEFDLYKQMCSQLYDTSIVLSATEYPIYNEKKLTTVKNINYQQWMMFADSQTYLTDDILTKVDRASMAVSLETRAPFLDHRIVEFAWKLPLDYKIQKATGKRILKDVLYRHIPQQLIDRPKMGFGVPLEKWLRDELKPWAAALLQIDKIKNAGYLDPDVVQRYWHEHQSGKQNWQAGLWTMLMFQAWLESW